MAGDWTWGSVGVKQALHPVPECLDLIVISGGYTLLRVSSRTRTVSCRFLKHLPWVLVQTPQSIISVPWVFHECINVHWHISRRSAMTPYHNVSITLIAKRRYRVFEMDQDQKCFRYCMEHKGYNPLPTVPLKPSNTYNISCHSSMWQIFVVTMPVLNTRDYLFIFIYLICCVYFVLWRHEGQRTTLTNLSKHLYLTWDYRF